MTLFGLFFVSICFIGWFKPVKYLFYICANVTLLVAVVELVIGLVGSFYSSTILKPMLINASVWLVLFFVSMSKLAYEKIEKNEVLGCLHRYRNQGYNSGSMD